MSNASLGRWSTTPWIVVLTLSHSPEALMIEKIKNTATTHMTPKAIESRNAVFVTDQGSTRTTRSLARRIVRGLLDSSFRWALAAARSARLSTAGAGGAGGIGANPGGTGMEACVSRSTAPRDSYIGYDGSTWRESVGADRGAATWGAIAEVVPLPPGDAVADAGAGAGVGAGVGASG